MSLPRNTKYILLTFLGLLLLLAVLLGAYFIRAKYQLLTSGNKVQITSQTKGYEISLKDSEQLEEIIYETGLLSEDDTVIDINKDTLRDYSVEKIIFNFTDEEQIFFRMRNKEGYFYGFDQEFIENDTIFNIFISPRVLDPLSDRDEVNSLVQQFLLRTIALDAAIREKSGNLEQADMDEVVDVINKYKGNNLIYVEKI